MSLEDVSGTVWAELSHTLPFQRAATDGNIRASVLLPGLAPATGDADRPHKTNVLIIN